MATEVFMPALGMAQETGKLIEWMVPEGQAVTKGEPIMLVETDKATVELEAPATGFLTNVTAQPGDDVPVGTVIALIVAQGEAPARPVPPDAAVQEAGPEPAERQAASKPASPVAARMAAELGVDLSQVTSSGKRIQKEDVLAFMEAQARLQAAVKTGNGRSLASPKARRLAREHNLDLHSIRGSGPDGAVLAADVLQAVSQAPKPVKAAQQESPSQVESTPEPAYETWPTSRMWQTMARRLTESWQTVPHFYLEAEANASQLKSWREQALVRIPQKVTYTDLIVKLVALALHRHPRLNASWVEGEIRANQQINIGLAVAVEEGLIVPVIHQADQLGLEALATRRQALVAGANANKLALTDLTGGTFTVSNLGMYGIDAFNAIINPPEAAILTLGQIADKVVPVGGQPVVQPRLRMVLSCDHRVVDGARGAQFLQTLVQLIEDPLAALD